jgi:hypothetical protein
MFEDYDWPQDVGWREWCELADQINQAEKKTDPINEKLTVNLSDVDRPIAIAFAGDIHLGGGFTDHVGLIETMDYIFATPNLYVSLCGDIFEGFLPSFRSAQAREQMPLSVKSQINAYKSLLNELNGAGKLIAVSYGDHDACWFEMNIGFSPAKHAIHDVVPYFDGRAIITVKLGDQEYYIVQNHRERFNSQWNRVQPSRRQYDQVFPGDVCVTGHRHSPSGQWDYLYPEAREAGLNIGGQVWFLVTGTWKSGPDTYSIRSWRRGIQGVPTAVLQPDRHEVFCAPSPSQAMAYVRGLAAA